MSSENAKQPTEPEKKDSNRNDFIICNGFPALRNADGEPILEGKDPIPRHPFLSYSSALKLDKVDFPLLLDDCAKVFSARAKEDTATYSAGCTYFMPAVMKPRCAMEALALRIFAEHTKDLSEGTFDPNQSGAEWWTLVIDAESPVIEQKDGDDEEDDDDDDDMGEDEVGMHFDADYGLEDQAPGLFLHPRVATITYLSNIGAPTLILNQQSPPPQETEKLSGSPSNGWLSAPKVGKHVAFDGRFLHGAPSSFFPGASSGEIDRKPSASQEQQPPAAKKQKIEAEIEPKRITFLVNVWLNHCPLDAELLDEDIVDQLQTKWEDSEIALSLGSPDKLETKSLTTDKDDPAGEEETIICDRLVTLYYNAKMERQQAVSRGLEGSSIDLLFTDNAFRIHVGGVADVTPDD